MSWKASWYDILYPGRAASGARYPSWPRVPRPGWARLRSSSIRSMSRWIGLYRDGRRWRQNRPQKVLSIEMMYSWPYTIGEAWR